jgi:hypothetical protein
MSFIAAAIVGVGAIAGGAIAASGAESAASTQAGAAEQAAQIGQQEFQTITAQEQPFMQAGYGALSALDYGLGIGGPQQSAYSTSYPYYGAGGNVYGAPGYDPRSGYGIGPGGGISQLIPGGGGGAAPAGGAQGTGLGYGSLLQPFTQSNWQQLSPAYNFTLQQGRQGVLNADAAGQGSLSGAALKDLTNYNQSAALGSFNDAFNMYQTQQGNIFDRLAGITQLGQAAAANTGQQGTALAGNIAQSVTNAGTASAAGTVGAANAISGGLTSAIPWLYGSAGGGGLSPVSFSGQQYASYNPDSGGIDWTTISDRRLKRDIVRRGTLPNGLPLYSFRYLYDALHTFIGCMADEVQKIIPQAVRRDALGYLRVNYRMVYA